MKAFITKRYGSNETIELSEVAMPHLGDNDVLVMVEAASVNPLDIRIRDGKLKQILPFSFPLILGNDFAGTVVKTGRNVTSFKNGDEVYARTDTKRIGSYAEYIALDQGNLAMKPKNLSMVEAASIPLVGLTCWQILAEEANVQKGQKVLIHGGSGGVGTFAIQLAKYLGAYVATTTSKDNAELVKQLGADEVIDYKIQDFEQEIKNYDLVLDTRGGETLDKSLNVLKKGGKVISVSGVPDKEFAKGFGFSPILQTIMFLMSYKVNKKAKKLGITYRFHFMKPSGKQLESIKVLLENNTIRPVIDKVFPFSSTKEALTYSEAGHAKGKIVVQIK